MKTDQCNEGLVLSAWLFIAASLAWAGGGYHVFTDINGRSVEGLLLEFNADQRTVTIQRKDNQTRQAPLAVFCESDQRYIWEQGLKNAVKISATIKNFDIGDGVRDRRFKPEDIKNVGYAITVENRSAIGLKDVRVNYRVFYRQQWRERGKKLVMDGVQCGESTIAAVPAGVGHELTTDPVLLCDEQDEVSVFGCAGGAKGEIRCVWVRVAATLPSGEKITREFRDPGYFGPDIDWPTATVLAGLNAAKANKPRSKIAPR